MIRSERGLSLVEVLVAIVIFAVGVLALAAGSGAVTRLLGGSRMATVAAQVGERKLDQLRAIAGGTTTRCTSAQLTGGTETVDRVALTWSVDAGGSRRLARVIMVYNIGGGRTSQDTLFTYIAC